MPPGNKKHESLSIETQEYVKVEIEKIKKEKMIKEVEECIEIAEKVWGPYNTDGDKAAVGQIASIILQDRLARARSKELIATKK